MPRSLTTRNPNGVTNAAPWQVMAAAGVEDPTWAYQNFHEFNNYIGGDWAATLVGAGNVGVTPAAGGVLELLTSAGATDSVFLQHAVATHRLVAGKDHFFKFKGQVSDVINTVVYFGLIATDTTPLTNADSVMFRKATGQASLSLESTIGGVTTSVAIPNSALVNATDFECGFHVTADGDIEAFFNPTTGPNSPAAGAVRGYSAVLRQPGVTQALLNISMGVLNSTAAAHFLHADYILGVSHR